MEALKGLGTMRCVAALGVFIGFGLGVGCTELLASHCANLAGDQTCAERGEAFCSRCVGENDGCTEVMPEEGCHFVGEEEASGSSSTSGTTGGSTTISSIDGGMTTEEAMPDSSTEPGMAPDLEPSCRKHGDCDNEAPFCVSGECVGSCDMADDGACATKNPGLPVCDAGVCVECTKEVPDACSGVCSDSNNCVACSEHFQCGEAACNFYSGECLPADAVVHVGPGLPIETLADAVASFAAESEGTIIIHQGTYADEVLVDGGRTLAFLANTGELPVWQDLDGMPVAQLSVNDGTAILDGVRFSERVGGPAIEVTGVQARAWMDRSHINNRGGGILARNGAEITIRNCFVGGDASALESADNVNALEVNEASATVLYSTLGAGEYNAVALFCSSPISVVVRNSIIVAQGTPPLGGADIVCSGAEISYSIGESFFGGTGNLTIPEIDDPGDYFVDYVRGNFRLQNSGPLLFEVAQWNTGDPGTDINGDPRPDVDGTLDYAGADLP